MATHIVNQGESIPSIAKDNGFFWKTIWDHGNNKSLKDKRKNPNVLYEGDEVFIPELEVKEETGGNDARHKFRRKGEPVKIAIKLLKTDGTPRSNEPYVFTVGDKEFKGNTDGDGLVKQAIPNDAKSAMLSLKNGKEVMPVAIGSLNPVDELSGVQQRLANMGYDCPPSGAMCDATERAITNFQSAHGLDPTGKMEDAVKKKLMDLGQ